MDRLGPHIKVSWVNDLPNPDETREGEEKGKEKVR